MQIALQIKAYGDQARTDLLGIFECQINPEDIEVGNGADRDMSRQGDATATPVNYQATAPQDFRFTFLIDATGVVGGSSVSSVEAEIDRFKTLAFDYNGKIHAPNHLTVLWKNLSFRGRLSSLNIDYTLFDPTGTALRAKLTVRVNRELSPEELARRSDRTSPDLTHL